jgi:hypothetical protein
MSGKLEDGSEKMVLRKFLYEIPKLRGTTVTAIRNLSII